MLNNNQEFNSGLPPVTKVVLLITIGVFLLQMVSKTILPIDITGLLALNLDSVLHGQIWRFVTYIFLHGNFWHIFINMFMLVMFGAEMERVLGVKRFILLYFVSGILGGLGWILISGSGSGYCIGASGAVFGLMGAFAAIFPLRKLTLLLFFVLPITMTARTMAIVFGLISLFAVMGSDGNIAHAAHLAGGLAGYLYGRNIRLDGDGVKCRRGCRVDTRFRRKNIKILPNDSFEEMPSEDEVNALLEKITDRGISSLSQQERDTLKRVSDKKKHVS